MFEESTHCAEMAYLGKTDSLQNLKWTYLSWINVQHTIFVGCRSRPEVHQEIAIFLGITLYKHCNSFSPLKNICGNSTSLKIQFFKERILII